MGIFDGIKTKLGFGDEEYAEDYEEDEDYYAEKEVAAEREDVNRDGFNTRTRSYLYESPYGSGAASGAVRRRPRTPDLERAQAVSGTPLRSVPTSSQPLSPMGPQMRIHNARPTTFEEASSIADRFKAGTPVVLDLSSVAADQQRRYIDFASGLTYGLDGGISKVADSVFMLTPANVEVSEADRRRWSSSSRSF